MASNRGTTTLKCRSRTGDPMRAYDKMPAPLRQWVAGAKLRWRPRSVVVAYEKALDRTGNPTAALDELDRIQEAMVARDAGKIWGTDHPAAR